MFRFHVNMSREYVCYSLGLECSKASCVKGLVLSLVLLGSGGNFKRFRRKLGLWGCALEGDNGDPAPFWLFFFFASWPL
jgi:hypothetical protein